MHTYSPFGGHHHHGHFHGHHHHNHHFSHTLDNWRTHNDLQSIDRDLQRIDSDLRLRNWLLYARSPGGSANSAGDGCLGFMLLVAGGCVALVVLISLIGSAVRPIKGNQADADAKVAGFAANDNRPKLADSRQQQTEQKSAARSDSAVGKQTADQRKQIKASEKSGPATSFSIRAIKLADTLCQGGPRTREELIENFKTEKDVEFTEALAIAAAKLTGDWQAKVREALAIRLTRMTAATLTDYLHDPNREIRRAAALACGTKESKAHIHELIRLLADDDSLVVQAARASLKRITGLDHGPDIGVAPKDRITSVLAWRAWEQTQQ